MRSAAMFGVGIALILAGVAASGQAPGSGRTELAKEADAWLYPRAKVVGTAESGGRAFQAVQATDDGLAAVLGHYDAKCGTSLADDDVAAGAFDSRSEVADGKVRSTLSVDDSTAPVPTRKRGASRGVTLRQVTRDEPGFFVTVLVTRTKEDAATHLLVTYLKK